MRRARAISAAAGLLATLCAWPAAAASSPEQAARFLTQASFGPTPAQIDQLSRQELGAWLDEQMAMEPSLHRPETEIASALGADPARPQAPRQEVWWRRAVTAPDQLRQRVAFALSEILVVSDREPQLRAQPLLLAEYYDVLVRGAFGNYRQLLEDVTLAPAMGVYLSMIINSKPSPRSGRRPDENFAREIMQLFSIGLWELNADGSPRLDGNGRRISTYDQETVENFARAYTGWGWADGNSFGQRGSSYQPMKPYDEFHDKDAKRLLRGVELPAGQSITADLRGALDNLHQHSNTGPFLARRLIQRLVSSNPSPAYVQRVGAVFNDNGAGVRGDLGAVVRAILLDEEARRAPAADAGKLREPLLRLTAVWRAFNAAAANGRYAYPDPERDWGQAALGAPSVFNFFAPDYSAPGALAEARLQSPEFQLQTESRSIGMINAWTRLVRRQSGCAGTTPSADRETIMLDLCAIMQQAADPPAMLRELDLLLLYGQMKPALRERLLRHVERIPASDALRRASEAIFLIVVSPQFAVQK